MKAIGNNLIIKKIEESNQQTKGGLLLTEKQREDVRFQKAKVVKVGDSVVAVKQNDIIYVRPNNAKIKSSGLVSNASTLVSILSLAVSLFIVITR